MGLLKLFSKPSPAVQLLPSGTMTVDRQGQVLATTVSSAYPAELLGEIARRVVELFTQARAAQVSVSELSLEFASLRIVARELRGGAIVFLTPKDHFNAC